MIERKIIIGLITQTEYLRQLEHIWNPDYIESNVASTISKWCWEYFIKYRTAPLQDIEVIYIRKLKRKAISKDLAEEIEQDILPSLSEEYERKGINVSYLIEETKNYFLERQITIHNETVSALLEKGKVEDAQKLLENFKPLDFTKEESNEIDLSDEDIIFTKIESAFDTTYQNVIKFPGPLGEFWNEQLVRGGFVSILSPEKRGKCLTGTQKVLMSTGEEISINNLFKSKRKDIISFDEEKQIFLKSEISDFYKNGIKKVYEVTTKTGRKVQVTKNHPFLTPDGWKDLTKIGKGSFIAVPKKIDYFGNSNLPEHEIKLIAYFITEGCLREYKYDDGNGTYIHIGFTSGEKNIRRDFKNCIEQMGCSVSWKGINGKIKNSKINKGLHEKNYVLSFLKEHNLFNKLCYDKVIPDIIFKLPKKDISLFLRILFTCDGWITNETAEIGFGVANEVLSRQVQTLLTKFGIVSRIIYKENNKAGAWIVNIRDYENIILFFNEIGFTFSKQEKAIQLVNKKQVSYKSFLDKFPWQIAKSFHDEVKSELGLSFNSVFTHSGSVREQIVKKAVLMRQSFLDVKNTKTGNKYFNSQILWDEIISVQYIGEEETYDLTVKNYHNFVAENILVHNTFWLLEFMFRAFNQKRKVAFFQAGDMTENQQLIRICIYVAKKSNIEKYCGKQFIPVLDCIKNQADTCRKKERECDFGVLRRAETEIRGKITKRELVEAYVNNPKYRPCYNCLEFAKSKWGTVWLKEIDIKQPLNTNEAKRRIRKLFIKAKHSVKIATYVNGTLTLTEIRSKLKKWREEGFVPDVILVDYADLLESEIRMEERPKQNYIWKGLRALSQEGEWLLVAPTQADAASYKTYRLDLENFSEDKRKYAHVTAMYGLNQDPAGREKELGIMRINKIIVREGDFHPTQEVNILQRLQIGRPFLGSFY
jgi:intein/homing endonuclease